MYWSTAAVALLETPYRIAAKHRHTMALRPEELLGAGTKPFGEPVIQDLGCKHSRERLVGLSSTRAVQRASERTPHTEFECVRLVFVAGENPRQAFGGVVFEQKNLIAD